MATISTCYINRISYILKNNRKKSIIYERKLYTYNNTNNYFRNN